MLGGPHILFGLAAGYGIAVVAHLPGTPLTYAVAAGLAATLPDQDLRWAPRWPCPRPGSPCHFLEHRGPTHSIFAAAVGGLATAAVTRNFGFEALGYAVFVGLLSHLFTDGISPMGVPYLWPLRATRYRLMPRRLRLHSGSLFEYPLALLACIGVALLGTGTAHADGPPAVATQRALANLINDCAQGTRDCRTPVPTPTVTPTLTPTVTPSATVVPTDTPTPVPTATPTPCYQTDEDGIVYDEDGNPLPCVLPATEEPTDVPAAVPVDTPTSVPTATPVTPPTPYVIVLHEQSPAQVVVITATPTDTPVPTPPPATATPTGVPTAVPTAARTPTHTATVLPTPQATSIAPVAMPTAAGVTTPADIAPVARGAQSVPPDPVNPQLPTPAALAGAWFVLAHAREVAVWARYLVF